MADEVAKTESNIEEATSEEALDIVEIVTQENPGLFNGVNSKKRNQIEKAFSVVISKVQQKIHSHSGPLPAPETLRHYNEIITDGAERIMAMAEREQAYRHGYTNNIAKRQLNQITLGQWFGFILGLFALCGGVALAFSGKETSGIATIIGSISVLGGAFIYGRHKEKDSNKTK